MRYRLASRSLVVVVALSAIVLGFPALAFPGNAQAAEPLWYGTLTTTYSGAGRVPALETVTYELHPTSADPATGWTQNVTWEATYDDTLIGTDCKYTMVGEGAGGPQQGAYIGPGPDLYTIVASVSDSTKYDIVMTGEGTDPACVGVDFQAIPLGFGSELTTATTENGVKVLRGSRTDANGGTFTWDLTQGSLADTVCAEERAIAAAVHVELQLAEARLAAQKAALAYLLALPRDQRNKEAEREMRALIRVWEGDVRSWSKEAKFWDAVVDACLARALP